MKYFDLLGLKVRDKVTGFEGVAESVCYDLYGCIQVVVRPAVDKSKPAEKTEGYWYDAKRLEVISPDPVMPVPTFEQDVGPTAKPYRA